jgi:hypothetical protein
MSLMMSQADCSALSTYRMLTDTATVHILRLYLYTEVIMKLRLFLLFFTFSLYLSFLFFSLIFCMEVITTLPSFSFPFIYSMPLICFFLTLFLLFPSLSFLLFLLLSCFFFFFSSFFYLLSLFLSPYIDHKYTYRFYT